MGDFIWEDRTELDWPPHFDLKSNLKNITILILYIFEIGELQ